MHSQRDAFILFFFLFALFLAADGGRETPESIKEMSGADVGAKERMPRVKQ